MAVIISETQRLNDSTSSEGMTKITFPVAVVVAMAGDDDNDDYITWREQRTREQQEGESLTVCFGTSRD
jgi:hypothetical protein